MKTLVKVLEKSSKERRYTLGVVYEPNVVDTQGDFAKAEDIETAAWGFMARLQSLAKSGASILKAAAEAGDAGIELEISDVDEMLKGEGLDDQHMQVDEPVGIIVESYIAPCDLKVDGETVKKGAWLLGVQWTEEMFEKIKKGERTGLSMYGRTEKVETKAVA